MSAVSPPLSLMDLSYEAQELSALLLSSSSSADIENSCRAVESFIQRHNADQCRQFYVVCFPVLLRKIFGFEDSSQHFVGGGWIAQTCDFSASALVNLLSPSGPLFCSMLAADEQNLVRYVFPTERLPAWIRSILLLDRGLYVLSDLCPALFKCRLNEDGVSGAELFQVQLNIFEYFMFWFAYYVLCIDNSSENEIESNEMLKFGRRRVPKLRLEKWAPSLPGLHPSHGRISPEKVNSRPYLHLVNLYLHAFVPVSDCESLSTSPSPYLHHRLTKGRDDFSRAEFVVHTFVQFWLVDGDASPISSLVCKSLNISLSFEDECCRYIPPSADHTEAVKILVNYVNSSLQSPQDESISFQSVLKCKMPLWSDFRLSKSFTSSLGAAIALSPWSQCLQRPLYRFILRAFLYWPVGACVKKLASVLDLWVDYLEPWNSIVDRQSMLVCNGDSYCEAENKMLRDPVRGLSTLSGGLLRRQKGGADSGVSHARKSMDDSRDSSRYNEQWQYYVLANYPFYTALFCHFLTFANKFVHIDTEAVLQMTLKVLNVLASSWELLSLLRSIEFAYNNVVSGNTLCSSDNLHKFVPAIQEQIQEWEIDSFSFEKESQALFSSLQKGAPTLQLFNASQYGGHQILKILILRAEAWIQTSSPEKMQTNMQSLEALKALTIKIFGSCEIGSCDEMACTYVSGKEDVPIMKLSGLGRHTWADVKYKGDWMKRPIGETEVAWLARLLVRFSDWLNKRLGLDDSGDSDRDGNFYASTISSEPTFAEIPVDDEVSIVDILSDWTTWTNLLSKILSCFMFYSLWLLQAARGVLRRNGWRINLRNLAEKKVLLYACTCIVFVILTKIFKFYCSFLFSTNQSSLGN